MSNKKETPVSWLVKEISRDRVGRAIITTFLKEFEQAKELESQKQQKYDEMLAMLEVCKQTTSSFDMHQDLEQLIKEAKEL
jgi:hypothetical protein